MLWGISVLEHSIEIPPTHINKFSGNIRAANAFLLYIYGKVARLSKTPNSALFPFGRQMKYRYSRSGGVSLL